MEKQITKKETTALKGAAIIMVVIQHIGQAFKVGVVNPLGPIGVFLFLFLSGYGLSRSYLKNKIKNYFAKRIVKVYLPYACAVVLFIIWSFVIHQNVTPILAIKYFCLLSLPQGSYWYLILMFYWYIIFYFVINLNSKPHLMFIVMLVASIAITYFMNFSRSYVWQLFSFPIGVVVGLQPQKASSIIRPLKSICGEVLLLGISILMVILKKTSYVEMHELGLLDTALQIGITLCLGMWFILKRQLLTNLLCVKTVAYFAGIYSYELYLSHVIPLDWLKSEATVYRLAIYLVIVALVTIIITVLNRIFSKKIMNRIR